MALLLHYTGQDYISRGLLKTELTPGSTSAFADGCKTGKGFTFDGTVNSSLSGNVALNHDEFSLSCWFKITATPPMGGRNVIFATNPATHNRILFDVDDNNTMRFGVIFGTSVKIVLGGAASLNVWYHMVGICDDVNKIVKIFVNGMLINQAYYVGELNIADYFSIGWRPELNLYFNGQICNFKYYNHVLSAREIAEDYKSLMLHYKLDKPITTQVFDYSGFNRHITNLTTNTVTLDSKSQVYSASLKNNGTQSLIGTSDLTDLNGLDEGSFSFWAFLTTNNLDYQYVIDNTTAVSPGNGITVVYRGCGSVVAFFCGTRIEFKYRPTVNAWHHIVLVKTSTQIKVYANNVNIYTVTATTSSKNFSNRTSISSRPDKTLRLNGNVQDIRFYAKALTQADVTELYQTRHMVDKDSNCYTYELIEGQSDVGMNKQGQLLCDEVIEGDDGVFKIVKSNKTIKTKEFKEI